MNWELPLVPERKKPKDDQKDGKRHRGQLKRVPTGLVQNKLSITIDHGNNRLDLLNKIGKHEPILIYIIHRLKLYEKWELHSFKIPLYKALRRRNSGKASFSINNCCEHHQPWDTQKFMLVDRMQQEHRDVLCCFCGRSITRFQTQGNMRRNKTKNILQNNRLENLRSLNIMKVKNLFQTEGN